jgi:hypothetical protein
LTNPYDHSRVLTLQVIRCSLGIGPHRDAA